MSSPALANRRPGTERFHPSAHSLCDGPHELTRRETPDIQQKRKSQLLGLDRWQRQICPFCMAELMVATARRTDLARQPRPAATAERDRNADPPRSLTSLFLRPRPALPAPALDKVFQIRSCFRGPAETKAVMQTGTYAPTRSTVAARQRVPAPVPAVCLPSDHTRRFSLTA